MPYTNEYSKHRTISDLINNRKLKDFIQDMQIVGKTKKDCEKIDENIIIDSSEIKSLIEQQRLKYIFSFDGSKSQMDLNLGYPGAEVGILKINQTFIDLVKMEKYENNPFPHPKEYEEIFVPTSFEFIVPGLNVGSLEYKDPKDFFRFCLYDYLNKTSNPFVKQLIEQFNFEMKSFLETYIDMLKRKPEDISCLHPCDYCASTHMLSAADFWTDNDGKYLGSIKCKCKHNPRDIFITDLLHFHEGFSYMGSNDGLYTQIMSFVEKLVFINLIQNFYLLTSNEAIKEEDFFNKTAFILDGPLAIYNYASWFATAISDTLIEMQEEQQYLIIGVEKTGHFMQHLIMLDTLENKDDLPLKNGMLFFINDNYIKRNIKYSTSPVPYGKNFYFGKKLFYKNFQNQLFVVNSAYTSYEDREVYLNARGDKHYELTQHRIKDIVWIFEKYASSRFKNALSFISVAHENASISNNYFSKRVMRDFIETNLNQNKP